MRPRPAAERRRDFAGKALLVAAFATAMAALLLPGFAPEGSYQVRDVDEVVWGVRRNVYPYVALLVGTAMILAVLGVVLRGPRRWEGYVALGVVVALAATVLSLTAPRLRECGWSSHISGPFEDDFSCLDGLDGLTPVDLRGTG